MTYGNDYDVLTNGDQIFPPMLEAIHGAKRRISIETYIYESGIVADQFTAALEEAAHRGVRVNMVVDSVGGSGMKKDDVQRLKNAGCHIAQFNSPTWYSLQEVNYRTRRKILVVDGEIGFTGGVGFADHWLGHAQDKEHWRDTQVRMRGPIVRLLEAGFYENFIETAGEVTPELDDVPRELHNGGASMSIRELADRRQQRPEAALPSGDRLGAAFARHHVTVLRHRRVERLGVSRRRRTRRQGTHPRRG